MKARIWMAALGVAALTGAGAARADDGCEAPVSEWRPRSAVVQMAEARGWQVEAIRVDDGCYQIRATDAEGRRLRAKVDPATLEIVKVKTRGDGHDDRRGEGDGRRWRGGEGDDDRRGRERRRRGGEEESGRGEVRPPPPSTSGPAQGAPDAGLIGKPKAEIR